MPNAVIVDRMPMPSKLLSPSSKNENTDENADIPQHKIHLFRLFSITDKAQNTKQENVWERLSKVRKSASNDSSLVPSAKKKHIGRTRSTQRLPPLRNTSTQTRKKPLSAPNPNTNIRRSTERKPQYQNEPLKKRKTKSYEQPKVPPPPLVVTLFRTAEPEVGQFGKPIKELLTVRSMNDSKSSLDEFKDSGKKKPAFQYKCCANSLNGPLQYEFKELKKPKIILETSSYSNNSLEAIDFTSRYQASTEAESFYSSFKNQNNFERPLQQKQKAMHPEEECVIKNVVKSNKRCSQLKNPDDRLSKGIFKTQKRETLKQGTVVKSTMYHLDANQSLTALPMTSCPDTSGTSSDVQQVDVIFKNVPTLEKEISILRKFCEKLEASLKKRTTSSPKASSRKRRNSTAMRVSGNAFLMYDASYTGSIVHQIVGIQCLATVHVHSMGIKRTLGFACEFYIAHKTLVELKNEANRHFYLPMNGEQMELKRTNYMKLKQNPNILLQHLKSKIQELPFNVLDQGQMFFHSLLSKEENSSALIPKKLSPNSVSLESKPLQMVHASKTSIREKPSSTQS